MPCSCVVIDVCSKWVDCSHPSLGTCSQGGKCLYNAKLRFKHCKLISYIIELVIFSSFPFITLVNRKNI